MTPTRFVILAVVITVLATAISVGVVVILTAVASDGIVEWKVYGINATYLNDAGRQFDFKDRNVAHGSIVVPLTDERGTPLVREDRKLPPSTVVKAHIYVKVRVMEKVVYPAHDYIEWRYNTATVQPQVKPIPSVILRK